MGVTGPAPKTAKRRGNPDTFAWVSVADQPFTGPSPELSAIDWPESTVAWWETVRAMPHCVLWTPSDWDFALDTAYIHAAYIGGNLRQAAELRLRAGKLGLTYEDRMKLRIRYVTEEEPEAVKPAPAKVTSIAARRKRLAGA